MNLFIKKALIRAVKTIAQTAIATIGTAQVMGGVDWRLVASTSILAGILSIFTSVAMGLPEVETQGEEYLNVLKQQTERITNGEFDNVDYTETNASLEVIDDGE